MNLFSNSFSHKENLLNHLGVEMRWRFLYLSFGFFFSWYFAWISFSDLFFLWIPNPWFENQNSMYETHSSTFIYTQVNEAFTFPFFFSFFQTFFSFLPLFLYSTWSFFTKGLLLKERKTFFSFFSFFFFWSFLFCLLCKKLWPWFEKLCLSSELPFYTAQLRFSSFFFSSLWFFCVLFLGLLGYGFWTCSSMFTHSNSFLLKTKKE